MRRLFLLLALWFPLAAFSQTLIYVQVTYTKGARDAAGGTTAMDNAIQNQFTAINNQYIADGINIQLVALPYLAQNSAPPDSASAYDQYVYVRNHEDEWAYRAGTADISVHIYHSASTGSTMSSLSTIETRDSVAAVPDGGMNSTMELAISRIIGGSATGYAKRAQLLPGDPQNAGQPAVACYHTRESPPTDTSEVVPYPAYWETNSTTQTRATLQGDSCEVKRLLEISLGHCTTADFCHHSLIATSGSTGTCSPVNAGGSGVVSYPMAKVAAGAGNMITCTDYLKGYSKNANMTVWPYLPMGDASHDSVGAMNGRASHVAGNHSGNASVLNGVRAGIVRRFLNNILP